MTIRPAAVSGAFYHQQPSALKEQIKNSRHPAINIEHNIKAIIVPHAGYIYSGETAAYAYTQVEAQKNRFDKAIIVGPSHHHYFKGCALPESNQFQTPLGNIKLCINAMQEILSHPLVIRSEEAHHLEHSIEVQLPFIQTCMLTNIEIIPILTSDISPLNLAQIIEPLWTDSTLLIISSDLSHFHSDSDAYEIDSKTCQQIQEFDAQITPKQACGYTGINTLLLLALQNQYKIKQLYRTDSSETSGDRSRVVGYASYLITNL